MYNIITPKGILEHLKTKDLKLSFYESVDSTNSLLKEMALNGETESSIVIALSQSKGRGRYDRKFQSDIGGIYMSILLRPNIPAENAVLITTAAAVAVAEAVEDLSGRKTGIKWVNDVLIDGKKICGILTEASLNIESGTLDYAVIGIGLNVYEPRDGFPDEIRDIAGSIFKEQIDGLRSKLTAAVLENFFKYYKEISERKYLNSYRERCIVLGKQINVISASGTSSAIALDIDENCHLRVKYPNGEETLLSSGEVSIKI